MKDSETIETVRKDYSKGELVPPPKQVSAKPKEEWDWTFEWEATPEQMASGRQKIVGRINDAQVLSQNKNVLKFRYKRPSGKIVDMVLDRDNPETEFYFGRATQSDMYIRSGFCQMKKEIFRANLITAREKFPWRFFLKRSFKSNGLIAQCDQAVFHFFIYQYRPRKNLPRSSQLSSVEPLPEVPLSVKIRHIHIGISVQFKSIYQDIDDAPEANHYE